MPRLRRLRDPGQGPAVPARAGAAAGADVWVAGIGCAGRFASTWTPTGARDHGRAPALATGLALARPDLSIWVSPATATRCRSAATT